MYLLAHMSNAWSNRMHIHRYTVIFEPAEEGGYVVHVPALDGAATQGETLEEAREMAKDLIVGYLEALAKDGMPAPVEDVDLITEPVREVLEVAVD
jgi:predicted RNase H-like HicB family nuclease